MERITSRQNPLCAHLRRLSSSASYREECGEFLCDSPKLLDEALRFGAEVRTVLCTEGTGLPPLPSGVRTVEVPKELMAYVSPAETPQGILFTCTRREKNLPAHLDGRRYLILEGVQDPGNVGTVLRTADAFSCDGIFLLAGCADPFAPKTVRSSMGAVFRRDVFRTAAEDLLPLLRESGIRLLGAALRKDALDVRRLPQGRVALAVGNEGHGLSEDLLARCDGTVVIPMSPRCESLNAAVAASVLLWELYREEAEDYGRL